MAGQDRDKDGKYSRVIGSYLLPYFSNEPLDNRVEYKTNAREVRELDIIFDQHRKLFGWHTKSDLYRDIGHLGKRLVVQAIPNPDQELLEMAQQEEDMLAVVKRLRRHQHIENVVREMDETIKELEARRDFGAIRRALADVKATIKSVKDPVLKQAMQQAFDTRWGRMDADLNRSMDLLHTED